MTKTRKFAKIIKYLVICLVCIFTTLYLVKACTSYLFFDTDNRVIEIGGSKYLLSCTIGGIGGFVEVRLRHCNLIKQLVNDHFFYRTHELSIIHYKIKNDTLMLGAYDVTWENIHYGGLPVKFISGRDTTESFERCETIHNLWNDDL